MTVHAVLDVNVLLAAFVSDRGLARRLIEVWLLGNFTLVCSDGIIAELVSKLRRSDIRRRYVYDDGDIRDFDELLRREATLIEVPPSAVMSITGDPEDDYVLATARLGGAAYLVTRDKGLLQLRQYGETRIVSPGEFWAALRGALPSVC